MRSKVNLILRNKAVNEETRERTESSGPPKGDERASEQHEQKAKEKRTKGSGEKGGRGRKARGSEARRKGDAIGSR